VVPLDRVLTLEDHLAPVPIIAAAVGMRNLSAMKGERLGASQVLCGPEPRRGQKQISKGFIEQLRQALYAGAILTYAEGFYQLRAASQTYGYGLKLAEVARIWCGGIIRSALLEKIYRAYQREPDLTHLALDPALARALNRRQAGLRAVVRRAAAWGLPVPGLMAALSHFDGYRTLGCRPTSSRPNATTSVPTPTDAWTSRAPFTPTGAAGEAG